MISDVLFDAVEDIRTYQHDYPECYADIQAKIDVVVAEMDALRAYLDSSATLGGAKEMAEEGRDG
jgi:hypothetical protein